MSENSDLFPGFDHLFSMRRRSYVKDDFLADFEVVTPHVELIRGEWFPNAPLVARWADGRSKPREIAWGKSNNWCALSRRVQELFGDYKLTGWATYPIILHDKAGEVCEGYAGLSITGRCGPIDGERGELEPGQKPNRKFLRYIGLYFDETTWDGSDFFCTADRRGHRLVTENAKNVIERHDIDAFEFTPLAQTRWIKHRET